MAFPITLLVTTITTMNGVTIKLFTLYNGQYICLKHNLYLTKVYITARQI